MNGSTASVISAYNTEIRTIVSWILATQQRKRKTKLRLFTPFEAWLNDWAFDANVLPIILSFLKPLQPRLTLSPLRIVSGPTITTQGCIRVRTSDRWVVIYDDFKMFWVLNRDLHLFWRWPLANVFSFGICDDRLVVSFLPASGNKYVAIHLLSGAEQRRWLSTPVFSIVAVSDRGIIYGVDPQSKGRLYVRGLDGQVYPDATIDPRDVCKLFVIGTLVVIVGVQIISVFEIAIPSEPSFLKRKAHWTCPGHFLKGVTIDPINQWILAASALGITVLNFQCQVVVQCHAPVERHADLNYLGNFCGKSRIICSHHFWNPIDVSLESVLQLLEY